MTAKRLVLLIVLAVLYVVAAVVVVPGLVNRRWRSAADLTPTPFPTPIGQIDAAEWSERFSPCPPGSFWGIAGEGVEFTASAVFTVPVTCYLERTMPLALFLEEHPELAETLVYTRTGE